MTNDGFWYMEWGSREDDMEGWDWNGQPLEWVGESNIVIFIYLFIYLVIY